MVKVNRINISQIEGGYSDDSDKRPNGEMALYNDADGGFDLVIHDGVNSTNLNKVLGKGKLYGHGANSSDGNGYDTIRLIPDIPAYHDGSHQYLIIDPTGPNHVHLRAGGPIDNSNSELIVGGEHSYVKVGAGPNPTVYVKSNDYNWNFNTDGTFVAPNGATIGAVGEGFPAFYNSGTNNPVVVLNKNVDSGADVAAITLQPSITSGNGGWVSVVVAATGVGSYEYWHFKDNGVLELGSGGLKFSDDTTLTSAPSKLPTVVQLGNVSGSINTDASLGDIFDLTLTASGTLDNPTNGVDGQSLRWRISHDANSLTLNFGNKFKIPSSATSPLPISNTSGTMDLLGATYDSSRDKWDIISFVPGY